MCCAGARAIARAGAGAHAIARVSACARVLVQTELCTKVRAAKLVLEAPSQAGTGWVYYEKIVWATKHVLGALSRMAEPYCRYEIISMRSDMQP